MTLDRTLATVHGVVRNAATGEGLPRAQIRFEGDANTGALTDGDGRFEIPNIPIGPQQVTVQKPGFLDQSFAAAGADNAAAQALLTVATGGHNVMVAAEMPDVVFTLAPTGAIRGQVELSTGDPAEGIAITLAKRGVEDGRAVWQPASGTRTHSDGTFRIGGLADGEYAIFSETAMDSDLDGMPGGAGQRWGYPSVYFPDARDPSGAAKIRVVNGQETQANLTLTLEPFQAVTAAVVVPQAAAAERAGMNLSATVLDSAGHTLPYHAQVDPNAHSVQAVLPDGSYMLLVQSVTPMARMGGMGNQNTGTLVGMVDVTVAGHAVPNLRVALSAPRPSPVQVTVIHNAAQPLAAGRGSMTSALVSQAEGWIDDGIVSAYADGAAPGPLETAYMRPGSYWVHTHIQRGLCESSFTAGGANLAREPVVIGLSGSTAPMELAVRDDCAGLQVSLPESLGSITAGEEPFFTVFVVPDFDSTAEVAPMVVRPSTGGSLTLNDLTPGNYHVYTFAGSVQLTYRNHEALALLPVPGQAVTLSPGAVSNLVLEVAGQ